MFIVVGKFSKENDSIESCLEQARPAYELWLVNLREHNGSRLSQVVPFSEL
jgi:hypothetical protein